jgi:hypothetical protein
MTAGDIDPQIFGGLVENVKTLLRNQDVIANRLVAHEEAIRLQLYDSNKRMFDKIDGISKDMGDVKVSLAGIQPVIQQHENEIAALKSVPKQLITYGCAIIAAIGGAVAFWKGH